MSVLCQVDISLGHGFGNLLKLYPNLSRKVHFRVGGGYDTVELSAEDMIT